MLRSRRTVELFTRCVGALILILSLALLSSTDVYARSTRLRAGAPTSTQATLTNDEREELCRQATREVEESRKYIKDLENRLKLAKQQLKAAQQRIDAADGLTAAQHEQIALFTQQVDVLKQEIQNAKEEMVALRKDLDRVTKERDRALGRNKIWFFLGAALGATVVAIGVAAGND